MSPIKFFLYYYGTVMIILLVGELNYYYANKRFYNPLNMPTEIVFSMILAFCLLFGAYMIYYINELDKKTV